MTLTQKTGKPSGPSTLLAKAARLGVPDAPGLERLAVARGCWHYREPDLPLPPQVDESDFSNEELAIALLSPRLPYSPHRIRLGAAMLGAEGNRVEELAALARAEGCEGVVAYIVKSAVQFEPQNPHWRDLLAKLPPAAEPQPGILPHPTRFVSMTGITRAGSGRIATWIRPRADLAPARG